MKAISYFARTVTKVDNPMTQALIHSYLGEEYQAIGLSTCGIIFMGTPHNGGRGAIVTLGKTMIRLSSLFVSTNIKLLVHLEPYAQLLWDIEEQYGRMPKEYRTIFAFEERKTMVPVLGRKYVSCRAPERFLRVLIIKRSCP